MSGTLPIADALQSANVCIFVEGFFAMHFKTHRFHKIHSKIAVFQRYLRECDFGRYNHWIISGIWKELRKLKCGFTLGASTIRYRRSLELGNRVHLQSKILYWDEKAFYVEQRLINEDNFVCATVIAKQSVISPKGQESVTPQSILEALFRKPVRAPEPPPELESWLKYNIASSDRLKDERNKFHYQ